MSLYRNLLIEYAELTEQKNHLCETLIGWWSEDDIKDFCRRAESRELIWDIIITLHGNGFDFSEYPDLDSEIEYLRDNGDL